MVDSVNAVLTAQYINNAQASFLVLSTNLY